MDEEVVDKKQYALDILVDVISDYLYYDRKEDEDLTRDDMFNLIESGQLTKEEVAEKFKVDLFRIWEENFTTRKPS